MQKVKPTGFIYGTLWSHLASTYFYEGTFRGQAQELEKLIAWQQKHQPQYGGMHYWELGNAYEMLGEVAKAEKAYLRGKDCDSLVRLYVHQ